MFSVIIPLYNKAPYIQRAIDSVLNQSVQDFEIIVVNDGSTDGGEELVKEKYGDQIHLLNQTNQGVSAARNKGIAHAKFPWIAFLDADDLWHSDFLFWMKKIVCDFEDVGIVGSTYTVKEFIDKNGEPEILVFKDYFEKAIYNTWFTSSSTVISKGFFDKNSHFNENWSKGEDLDVWFRAISWFGKAYYVNEPLMFYDLNASIGTKNLPSLNKTIFDSIFNQDYLPKPINSWQTFISKFTYLNLFPFLASPNNFADGQRIIKNVPIKYSLAHLVYRLPYSWLRYIVNSSKLRSFTRSYVKFCFRYIYT